MRDWERRQGRSGHKQVRRRGPLCVSGAASHNVWRAFRMLPPGWKHNRDDPSTLCPAPPDGIIHHPAPFPGVQHRPLEIFFPFDPYLLRRSAAFLALGSTYVRWRRGHPAGAVRADLAPSSDSEDGSDSEAEEVSDEEEDAAAGAVRGLVGFRPRYTHVCVCVCVCVCQGKGVGCSAGLRCLCAASVLHHAWQARPAARTCMSPCSCFTISAAAASCHSAAADAAALLLDWLACCRAQRRWAAATTAAAAAAARTKAAAAAMRAAATTAALTQVR